MGKTALILPIKDIEIALFDYSIESGEPTMNHSESVMIRRPRMFININLSRDEFEGVKLI